MTDRLSGGYLRKNGAPYSEAAVLTEYYDLHAMPNGDLWLSITSRLTDPVYLSMPYIMTTDLKRLPGDEGWNPGPCAAK